MSVRICAAKAPGSVSLLIPCPSFVVVTTMSSVGTT
jgi:hypothetical protein